MVHSRNLVVRRWRCEFYETLCSLGSCISADISVPSVPDLGGFASSFFSGIFGNNKHQHHQHQHNQQSHQNAYPSSNGDSGDLLVVAMILFLAFVVYKYFLSGNTDQTGQDNNGQAGNPGGYNQGPAAGPPPPGFKPDYTGKNANISRF